MARKKDEPKGRPGSTAPLNIELPTEAHGQEEFVRLVHWLYEGVEMGTLAADEAWSTLIDWLRK